MRRLPCVIRCQRTLLCASTITTPCWYHASSNTAGGSLTSSPAVSFSVDALPPALREEFDTDANVRALSHVLRRHSKVDHPVSVLPTWAHMVSWRCRACRTQWSARPKDRTDRQTCEAFNCPCCTHVPTSTAATTTVRREEESHLTSSSSPSPRVSISTCKNASSGEGRLPQRLLLLGSYPTLAAQWDVERNSQLHNRVPHSVATVPAGSGSSVWWRCSLCERPWLEKVSSRVARHEALRQRLGVAVGEVADSGVRSDVVSLCPSCESRGATDRVNQRATSTGRIKQNAQQLSLSIRPTRLSEDAALMQEVRLRPHEDPSMIVMASEQLLNWECRFCGHGFQASVAGRSHRYERCPQCSGSCKTPMNLLSIQRPDVLHEVSKTVSRTALAHTSIHDNKELTFVCRRCLAPYRMSVRARCSVPVGSTACPKCFLNESNYARAAIAEKDGAKLSQKERRTVLRLAHRTSTSVINRDTLALAQCELQRRRRTLRD